MFKKFCAGIFVSGSVLSSVIRSSGAIAAKSGMSVEEIYKELGQVKGFGVVNNPELREDITLEQIGF